MKFRDAYRDIELYEPGRLPVDVDLSDNTNLFGIAPSVRALFANVPDALITRYPSVFAKSLKQALAEKHGVAFENIATGCGSDDIIDSAMRAFCEPGETVAYPWPTFGVVGTFARMNAAAPVTVATSADFSFDTDALVNVRAAVNYVCSPNNPTGSIVSEAQIAELDARLAGLLLLDEAYSDYDVDHADYAQFAITSQRTVSLRTMSKAHGLGGLRVGYCIGPAAIIHEIEKSRGPYKVGGVAEAAAVAVVSQDNGWVANVIEQTLVNRKSLVAELERLPVKVYDSHANFILIGLPDGFAANGTNAALRAHGVAARPFTNLPHAGEALRVTVGPWEMMEKFLDALRAVLSA